MEIFNIADINNLKSMQKENLSLALGFFDGVHLAHKKILSTASNLAKENSLKSAVITFKKSPKGVFSPEKNICLQTFKDRLSLIEETGVNSAYVLDFEGFKHFSAEEYLKDVLIKYFNPKFIVTGFNHTFGAKKEGVECGNSEFLSRHQSLLGYKYIEIEKMRLNNTLVSSTNIKKFIEKAYIKEANTLLGYDFNISGCVVSGMGLARELGYRTANLNWSSDIVKPPYGVYFGVVEYAGAKYRALLNWGIKPTVSSLREPVLEAHILDFNRDIYGENIKVFFKIPIREEKKFSNVEELKTAISSDIQKCRNYNY